MCQARECRVRELNPGRWHQRRVCYHSDTCSARCTEQKRLYPPPKKVAGPSHWNRRAINCTSEVTVSKRRDAHLTAYNINDSNIRWKYRGLQLKTDVAYTPTKKQKTVSLDFIAHWWFAGSCSCITRLAGYHCNQTITRRRANEARWCQTESVHVRAGNINRKDSDWTMSKVKKLILKFI